MSVVKDLRSDITCRPLSPASLSARRLAPPQIRFIRAGTELYSQDEQSDEVFTIVEGWVFLHHILEDGRRQILDFLLPGDSCGLVPGPRQAMGHSAEALTDVTVAVMPRARFNALLAEDGEYAAAVVSRLCDMLSAAQDAVIDTGRRSAIEAVSNLLLRLEGRIREQEELAEGAEMPFPLTQEHLGDALGLTAVHVCRTLRILKKKGLVELSRHKLRVPSVDALRQVAGLDPRGRPAVRRAA